MKALFFAMIILPIGLCSLFFAMLILPFFWYVMIEPFFSVFLG